MASHLLLDTHILLWLVQGSSYLRRSTRAMIDRHWQANGTMHVSAITGWEIGQMTDRRRVTLGEAADAWFDDVLALPGYAAAPLTLVRASRAYRMPDLAHRDPGDRMLIATAIDLGCPLVTYDERIIAFATAHGTRYGFSVAS